ncbi:MAG: carboxypeptidase-like regulatory domain-containing protein [Reichenbachiella sp.]|uniref:DUF4943 family protein n=1 Tax=Reichenbachiella sp. TaxID=2184521 RepID=UPI00329845C6
MKLKIIVFISCFFLVQHAWSQSDEYLSISSKIQNEQGQPVSFAHLAVKGKNLGGITNENGFFSYKIPAEYMEDTLVVSSVGLASLELLISNLTSAETPVHVMVEQAIELEGITIYAPAKLLQQAFENFSSNMPETPYYKCSGIYTLTSEENEQYTLFEQLAFEAYYRGEQDEPGVDILGHRRSVDYSQFPALYSQKAQSHHFGVSREILGSTVYKMVERNQNRLEELELKITDIEEIDGKKIYVITELRRSANDFVSKYYNYYVSEEDYELIKISEQISNFSLRPNERMTNAGKYNTDLFEISHAYTISTIEGQIRVTQAERVFKSLNVERLTGHLLKVHKQTASARLFDFQNLTEQPEKFPSRLKLPDDTPYDEAFWNQWEANDQTNEKIIKDMTRTSPLKTQFATTNGLIVLKNSIREETFDKKDQRRQSKVTDVDVFIEKLISNNYNSDFAPNLSWEDIPALIEIANSKRILTNFPRNILGRYYIDQCQAGIIAMWLIDSIRKNEGKKPRKAWYISPFPILQSDEDTRQIKEMRSQGSNANVMIKNTDEKLAKAYESFEDWWSVAQQMNSNKAKRMNPLADTDLKWMGL